MCWLLFYFSVKKVETLERIDILLEDQDFGCNFEGGGEASVSLADWRSQEVESCSRLNIWMTEWGEICWICIYFFSGKMRILKEVASAMKAFIEYDSTRFEASNCVGEIKWRIGLSKLAMDRGMTQTVIVGTSLYLEVVEVNHGLALI